MFDVDRILASIAARRKGVIVRHDAFAHGISQHQLDDRVRAGVIICMYEGIYRHAAAPFTPELRQLAAVLACGPDAVLSHRSAAAVHRYPTVRSYRPEITSPHTDLPRIRGVTLHRTVGFHPSEVTVVNGLPVTSKGRTCIDYVAVTPFHVAQEVIAQAVIQKVLKPETVLAAIERSGGRGRPGTVKTRLIAESVPEFEGLESVLELRLAEIVAGADVPPPVRQHPLTCADGREVRLDLAWPDVKIAAEADGRRWHGTPARARRTAQRHASIVDTGWIHLVYGWADAHDTPSEVRLELESTHRARRLDRAA